MASFGRKRKAAEDTPAATPETAPKTTEPAPAAEPKANTEPARKPAPIIEGVDAEWA